MSVSDPEGHYPQLRAKVDHFFAEVFGRYRQEMKCDTGCYDCCKVDLSVTVVEAAAIARHLASVDEEGLSSLRAGSGVAGHCAALGRDGRCRIYQSRPLVCRSHGVPIRRREEGRALPVVDVCFRNFEGPALEAVPESDQLDQRTLSTMLAAVDAAFADSVGAPRGTRISLAELLANPGELFELS